MELGKLALCIDTSHETAERFNHRYDLLLRESFYLVETLLVLVELQPVVKKMDA